MIVCFLNLARIISPFSFDGYFICFQGLATRNWGQSVKYHTHIGILIFIRCGYCTVSNVCIRYLREHRLALGMCRKNTEVCFLIFMLLIAALLAALSAWYALVFWSSVKCIFSAYFHVLVLNHYD